MVCRRRWVLAVMVLALVALGASVPTRAILRSLQVRRELTGLRVRLRSEKAEERALAIRRLASFQFGFSDIAPAVRALQADPSPRVRTAAVDASREWLAAHDAEDDEARALKVFSELLRAMTQDPDPDVRAWSSYNVMDILEVFRAQRRRSGFRRDAWALAQPRLQKALEDPNREVRLNASEALNILALSVGMWGESEAYGSQN